MAYEHTSWGSCFENLATQAVGANLPDVLQMSSTDIINCATNGQVVDLPTLCGRGHHRPEQH